MADNQRKRRSSIPQPYWHEPSQQWSVQIELPRGADGKRRRRTLTGKTKKEVNDKIKATFAEEAKGLLNFDMKKVTVRQYLEHWLAHSIQPVDHDRTHVKYEQDARNHIYPAIGHILVSKLTTAHVETMVKNLKPIPRFKANGDPIKVPEKLAPRTIRNIVAVLSEALEQAVDREELPRNVAKYVAIPRAEKAEITPLSLEEAQQLIRGVKGSRWEVIYLVEITLGLRRGEVLGLRDEDVDLVRKEIRIRGALQRIKLVGEDKGKLRRTNTKTPDSASHLALPDRLVEALKQYRARREEERAGKWPDDWVDSGYFFVSERGTPIEPGNLNRHLRSVVEKLQLPKIRVHDLRHSCAALMIRGGHDLQIVKRTLRHSQISVTSDTYGHVYEDTQRDAATTLAGLFIDVQEDTK